MQKARIGVLISGGGTNLQSLINEIEKGNINGEIVMVISDRVNAYGIKRAKAHGIKGLIINKNDYIDRASLMNAIADTFKKYNIDLIVLAGFLTILTKEFVEAYKNKIVNVHPALIPSFCGKGYYGEKVHKAALDYGVKISGATVHFVDEEADTGPIILQDSVPVMENDTVKTLAARVLEVEHKILPKAVSLFCDGKLSIEGRKVRIEDTKHRDK